MRSAPRRGWPRALPAPPGRRRRRWRVSCCRPGPCRERKRCPVRCALRRCARSVSPAKRLLPAARPTPAQTVVRQAVEVVPGALKLEQDGAHARERSAVVPRPSASSQASAWPRRSSRRSRRRRRERRRRARPRACFLGGAFESAVLVEEAGVEVEDAFADEVEAEVPGLDHAGMDGADGDLVGVVAADGDCPGVELEVVADERSQRLVAVEADAVEVAPLRSSQSARAMVDDRRAVPPSTAAVSSRAVPSRGDEQRPARPRPFAGVQLGEAASTSAIVRHRVTTWSPARGCRRGRWRAATGQRRPW